MDREYVASDCTSMFVSLIVPLSGLPSKRGPFPLLGNINMQYPLRVNP